jgi:hypothetical protein
MVPSQSLSDQKRWPSNVTADDLFSGIRDFLRLSRITIGIIEWDSDPVNKGDPACTTVYLKNITSDGETFSDEHIIYFELGARVKSLDSRLGSGPFIVDMSLMHRPANAKLTINATFGFVAKVNPDRAISFLPIKAREGGMVRN